MRKLSILCDGPRDRRAVAKLVEGLIGHSFAPIDTRLPRLNTPQTRIEGGRGRGYARKITYAIRKARSEKLDGLIVALDADKDRHHERLKQAKRARDADRQKWPPFPAAIGESRPHFEAWLLDDQKALREALALPKDATIPAPAQCVPKEEIDRLWKTSDCAALPFCEIAAEIAVRLRLERCAQRGRTGLQAFADELNAEIKPLFAA